MPGGYMHVNIRDLNTLSHVHPEVHRDFQAGNFVIHKSSNGPSIDQTHEHNNNMVKEPWDIMRLTESPSALTRCKVA